jgi:hypothetical protein
MILQADLFSFEKGARSPRLRALEDPDEADVSRLSPTGYQGRKCARCGRPLNGGGLELLGFGLVCWRCFNKGGRRDGRGDLSSDATAERNAGYNWRR